MISIRMSGAEDTIRLHQLKLFCRLFAAHLLSMLTLLSCSSRIESAAPSIPQPRIFVSAPPKRDDIVVLMTIDGVRWQEVFQGIDPTLGRDLPLPLAALRSATGLMPNLHALAERQGLLIGSNSAPMVASSTSTVSLPGYSEILSGRTPSCANNDCPATTDNTLLDDWLQRESHAELAVISSWSRIARVAAKNVSGLTVSSGQSVQYNSGHFCEDAELCLKYHGGRNISPWPGTEDYRPDTATSELALAFLRARRPHFLFIGLGDTDEQAHRGDYPEYIKALHAADATLGAVARWLSEQESLGHRTMLVCTADHGRSYGFRHHGGAPEAARVWALFAGSAVAARKMDLATTVRLADIAPTVRSFLGLPQGHNIGGGRSLYGEVGAQDAEQRLIELSAR